MQPNCPIKPFIKTYEPGTLFKTKQNLFYSDDVKEIKTTNFNPFSSNVVHQSFPTEGNFFCKGLNVVLIEYAYFLLGDKICYRYKLLAKEKIGWVTITLSATKFWNCMLRAEQKDLIKKDLAKKLEVI